jgi:hypothetical protein
MEDAEQADRAPPGAGEGMIGRGPAGAPPGAPPEIRHDQGAATLDQAPCLGGVDLPPSLSDKYHGASKGWPEGEQPRVSGHRHLT